MKLLSFCIPTYNRGIFLSQLINSIINQLTDDIKTAVEICISDNKSVDDTYEIVAYYQQLGIVDIIYHVNPENIGAGLNYLQSVKLASGKYCWLMGSDDILEPNSINRMLMEIKNENIAVFICNRNDYDYNLNFIKKKEWLRTKKDLIIDFANEKEIKQLAQHSNSIGVFFSYLSSIVFNRNSWITIEYDKNFIEPAYSHVYKLLTLLKMNSKCKYINDALISCRLGNDSFHHNLKQRIFLDLYAYYELFVLFATSNTIKRKLLKILRREHGTIRLCISCIKGNYNNNDWKLLKKIRYPLVVVCFMKHINKNKSFYLSLSEKYLRYHLKNKL
jgi:abequosyltransferase